MVFINRLNKANSRQTLYLRCVLKSLQDIAPCSVNPDCEAGPSLGGGGARNLASEVISTAVSPEPVIARESGGHLGGGEGDHGDADRDGGG